MPLPTPCSAARRSSVDHTDIPTAVFSEPEVGVIGLTESEARQEFARVDIYKSSFRTMKMTLAARDTRCFFKLVVDGESDRVLGCHIVGPDAGEMIQLVGIAIKMNATKADFDRVMAVHPTAAEELVTMRTKAASYVREAGGIAASDIGSAISRRVLPMLISALANDCQVPFRMNSGARLSAHAPSSERRWGPV